MWLDENQYTRGGGGEDRVWEPLLKSTPFIKKSLRHELKTEQKI
uniref:Uncharacterized protein n=1 Tax=Anguilla anguilla TaxID=7936 RepID=A0A0E9TP51_ANGAN